MVRVTFKGLKRVQKKLNKIKRTIPFYSMDAVEDALKNIRDDAMDNLQSRITGIDWEGAGMRGWSNENHLSDMSSWVIEDLETSVTESKGTLRNKCVHAAVVELGSRSPITSKGDYPLYLGPAIGYKKEVAGQSGKGFFQDAFLHNESAILDSLSDSLRAGIMGHL